jgi:hypothetical protein
LSYEAVTTPRITSASTPIVSTEGVPTQAPGVEVVEGIAERATRPTSENPVVSVAALLRPSLARLLSEPRLEPAEFVYDELRQISVDASGRPVVDFCRDETHTFAERDPDRPKPSTGTNAGRDTDVDASATLAVAGTSTQAGRDADDPSEPIILTEASLDPDMEGRWVSSRVEAHTSTQAGRDADPGDPDTITRADLDPQGLHNWRSLWTRAASTSTNAGRDSDPGLPGTDTKASADQDVAWVNVCVPMTGQASDDAATGVVAF